MFHRFNGGLGCEGDKQSGTVIAYENADKFCEWGECEDRLKAFDVSKIYGERTLIV